MSYRTKLATGTAMALGVLAAMPAAAQTTAPRTPTPTTSTAAKPLKPLYRNVRSFYRNVRSFWGDVNPFYRNVRSFWGDIDPFYRNVRSFWGAIDPAAAAATVAGAPAYAGVGPWWEATGDNWEGIASRWQSAGAYGPETAARYTTIAGDLRNLVDRSKAFWGTAVTSRTGKSFEAGFSDALLSRHGINLANPASLANLPANQQSEFFINWYDGLMSFSGTDHADHWMKSVNWTPKLTQVQGSGTQAVIGLVDQFSASDPDTKSKLIYAGGTVFQPAAIEGAIHGAGVLSLINADHDGRGVMGIAPNAKVAAFNPFDASGAADWTDVMTGIREVGKERTVNGVKTRAAVINLSLGAPGTTLAADWRTVFKAPGIDSLKDKVLYVIAAGNDGHRQAADINMKDAFDSTFIVVGSVDPSGRISEFSNTPGNACLTEDRDCKRSNSLKESGYLKNRFITAPGELLLVSDGKGGVTRQSGTSLAAPLVAGAVALIHDRWPWFKDKPRDVAEMILGSARDAGAPGIDDVYGVGILDVEAAQAPLNFADMKFYLYGTAGKSTEIQAGTLERNGVQTTWTTKNMYLTGFEKVIDAERDFLIPLSSALYGATRNGEYFQDFVYNRMTAWIATPGFASQQRVGFSDSRRTGLSEGLNGWTMAVSGRMTQGYADQAGRRRMILNSTVEVAAPEGRFGLSFGRGDGAVALGGTRSLGMSSDFDPYAGGANPLLGFASGGNHVAASARLAASLDVKVGMTEQTRSLGLDLFDASAADRLTIGGMKRYKARAALVGVDYRPSSWLTVSASATQLAEPDAFHSVRTTAVGAFGDGTVSTGFTFSGTADVGSGISLFGSATGSRSATAGADAAIRIREAHSTAFQGGVAKMGLLGVRDSLRLSLAKPLSVTRGSIDLTQMQVIDRQTGEKGLVTTGYALENPVSRLVVEGLYGAPLLDGRAEIGVFGRGEVRDLDQGTPRLMLGSQFRLAL